jgi:hypothetical protein
MIGPLTTSLISEEAGWGSALVASLPRSLQRVDGRDGDIAIVDGRAAWIGAVDSLLDAGCRRILLADPGSAQPDRIDRLAQSVSAADAALVIAERVAGNPAMSGFRAWMGNGFGTLAITSRDVGTRDQMLLNQLRVLRSVGVTELSIGTSALASAALLAEADALLNGQPVHVRLAAVQSVAGLARHRLNAYAPTLAARLDLHGGAAARPARGDLFTSEGQQRLPAIHESAERYHLRALIEGKATCGANALRELADDIRIAASVRDR